MKNKYSEAIDYYKIKNYKKSFSILEELSIENCDKAQNKLGYMYLNGIFVKQNLQKAEYWWEKSANSDNEDSQCQLAYSYLEKCNYTKAIYWFTRATKNGHMDAMYILGGLYYYGTGIAEDKDKAIQLYEMASMAGHTKASTALVQTINKTQGRVAGIKKLIQIFFTRRLA